MSESESSSSLLLEITSTLLATATQSLSATIAGVPSPTDTSYPPPTETPIPPPPSSNHPYWGPDDLCDWTRTATNCRDAEFTKIMLVVSSVLHLIVALYGFWLLSFRNKGFSKIFTDLFSVVGTGVRPKPMDCLIFFMSLGSLVKIAGNLPLVFGALHDMIWLRIAIEQLYWVLLAFGCSSYFVGLLYAMPVTTREGIFAVYQPEAVYGSRPMSPIHVLTPTTVQKNFILAIGAIYPTVFGAGLGIASGVLDQRGQHEIARILTLLQYSNWVLILYSMAVMFFYYGLKYTFILRANIIIAEAALKAPRAAFGIGNLKSRSPARFLFIQLQITGFGGCAVTALAGTLCMLWVLFKDKILTTPNDLWPHIMAVFWTCAIALAFFVAMTLITAQSVRSRRRGMQEPSTSTSLSHSGGQKSSIQKTSKSGQQFANGSDPEAQLTQQSSYEDSFDSEKISLERYEDPHNMIPEEAADRDRALAAASVAAMMAISDRMDQEANAAPTGRRNSKDHNSWTPATPSSLKPLTTPAANTNAGNHSNIRESVFGGRTPREDGAPTSPTAGGFSMPSFPMMTIRSGSRNSMQQSRPTPSSSSRQSGSSKHGTSSSESYNNLSIPSPVVASPMAALQQQTQQQLQLLEQQQSSPRVAQRVQVKGGAFQSTAGGDNGGDLLYKSPSSPPQSPNRTKFGHPLAPISIPMPPGSGTSQLHYYDDAEELSMPMPPTATSPRGNSSPRLATSPRAHQFPQDLNLPPDMQFQQQHPLHQVAFKGLSPPPRATPHSPTSPSSPSRRYGGAASPPTSPTTPTTPIFQGQDSPRFGGGSRRGTASSSRSREQEREILSEPPSSPTAVALASRGPGGGYHRGEASLSFVAPASPPQQPQPQSLRNKNTTFRHHQQQQQQQNQRDQDDNASVDSAGDDTWPLPPTFKA
ncbi:MAG: hypothetical protein J3Q66DRAFT_404973 [Benniella sp.]|nr:MAG: hypothetical protein J3Q66DRAFT_404973 [Benniella sp.]